MLTTSITGWSTEEQAELQRAKYGYVTATFNCRKSEHTCQCRHNPMVVWA